MSGKLRMVVISSPNFHEGENRVVCKLLEHGLDKYHLRKPEHSIFKIAEFLNSIPKDLLRNVIIHRQPELLNDYPVGGYHHYSGEPLLKTSLSRSRSLHKLSELKECEKELDYVFFGPVYRSLSKVGYKPKISLSDIRKSLSKMEQEKNRTLVYAIGGIRRNKISYLLEAGFNGVALLGSIWGKSDPIEAFKEFSRAVEIQSNQLYERI